MLLEMIGRVFCKTLVDITDNKERVKRVMQDLQIRFPVNAPVKKGYACDDDEEEQWRNEFKGKFHLKKIE